MNVSKNLRTENELDDLDNHESVRKKLEFRASSCISFDFEATNVSDLTTFIKKLDSNKAAGCDKIPAM